MKKQFIILALLAFVVFASSCSRIDAGHTGIKVKMYGSEKGVQDVTAVTGRVWYNPATVEIFEFPTFVQTKRYPIKVTDADGMSVSFESVLNYSVPSENVPDIFVKYRKTLPELEDGIINTIVRKATSTVSSKRTATEMYEEREQFQLDVQNAVTLRLSEEGFDVDEFAIAGEMVLPEKVKRSIEMKVEATQAALRKQQELAQTQADAAKQVAQAEGQAKSSIALAEGRFKVAELDAKSNKELARSITSALIQYKQLEVQERKWDGKYPTTLVGDKAATILLNTGKGN